jgi:subtilase family serine protease
MIVSHVVPLESTHTVNSTIELGVFVDNIGWADAGASRISYQWEDESGVPTGPVWYNDTTATPWGKYSHMVEEVDTSGLDPGNWTLNLTADVDDDITEIDETNNWLAVEFELEPEPLPNLVVTNVSIVPSEVTTGSTAKVTVSVENDGTAAAPASDIMLYLDDPLSPLDEGTVQAMAKGAGRTYVVNIGPLDLAEGTYVLNVTVDPDDLIKELDEGDNAMALEFTVTPPTLPDLVIEEVDPLNTTVTQGEQTRTQVVVANVGGATVTDSFEVALFLNQAHTVGTTGLMATATVTDDVPAGENVTLVLIWTVPEDTDVGSDHFLRAEVDWMKAVDELDDANNNATFNGLVVKRQNLPDLTVTQVFPTDPDVKLETRITFTATVKNVGTLPSSANTLEVKDITHNKTLDRVSVQDLEINGSVDVEFSWFVTLVPEGTLELRFLVDPDDLIAEEDEFNNGATLTVTVLPPDLPDLTFSEEDAVVFTPASPRVGESVTVSVSVRNVGTNASADTTLELRLGNNVIATTSLLALGVGESRTIDVPWSASEIQSPLEYSLSVRLDPDGHVTELNTSNNDLDVKVTFVSPPSPVLDNLEVAVEPSELEDGGEVTITVTVENTGDEAALITIGLKDGVTDVDSKQGITVPAGGSKTETFKVKLKGTGDHVMTVTLYEGDQVANDPSGNPLEEDVVVKVTEKEEEGSNTMLIVVAVVVILVVVVAVVFFLRRK